MKDDVREAIGQVLGRTPSGIYILTVGNQDGQSTGMLASWVQQASFEPPMVTVAVNKKRYVNDWLNESPQVVLNLVGEDQKSLLGHFGRGFEPDQPAFDGLETNIASNGLPVLNDALGYLEGQISGMLETGDHFVYAIEIQGAQAGESLEDSKPMVHIRRNGFNY